MFSQRHEGETLPDSANSAPIARFHSTFSAGESVESAAFAGFVESVEREEAARGRMEY